MRLTLVVVGGGIGSMSRYLVGLWVAGRLGSEFPWGTLMVNIAGSFLIGLIATLADEAGVLGGEPRAFLVVGMLGGFTTFSSFALESWRLADGGSVARSLLYIGGSVVFSGISVVLGVFAARFLS
jgi:CrcB protein